MPDIAMCCRSTCQKAKHCYRLNATQSFYQVFTNFHPVVENGKIVCVGYIPITKQPE